MYPPHSDDPRINDDTAPQEAGQPAASTGYLVPAAAPAVPAPPMIWQEPVDSRPEILNARPDPLALLKALRRHWILAGIIAVCAGGAAFMAAYLLIPLNYEVGSLIRVSRVEDSVSFSNSRPKDSKAVDAFIRTQPILVTSPKVLGRAVRDPDVSRLSMLHGQPDKVRWLKENLLVGYLGESEVMEIKMRDSLPKEMVLIVNAVTEAYMEDVVNSGRKEKGDRLTKLEEQLSILDKRIVRDEETRNKLRETLGAHENEEANARERILLSQLLSAEANQNRDEDELRKVNRAMAAATMAYQVAKDPKHQEMMIQDMMLEDPQVQELTASLRGLQQLYSEESRRVAKESPSLKGISNEISRTNKQLNDAKSALMPYLMQQYEMRTVMEIEMELRLGKLEEEALKKQIVAYDTEIAGISGELDKVRKYDSQLEAISRSLESDKKTAEDLKQDISALQIDLNLGRRITPISNAEMPEGIERRFWLILVAFCGASGSTIAVVGFAFAQFMQRRVESADQVNRGLGLTVMGTLPDLSMANGKASKNELLHGVLAESIDGIRTMLLYGDPGASNQVVMVTSASEQEGKSTVASQLAASLARSGKKTLLLDGDLRNPAVHEIFEMPLGAGFSELARGAVGLDDVVQNSPSENLWVMTAGHCNTQSIQCLAHDAVRDVFTSLRARFDFIIIDSGPILAFADSLLLGQLADAAILSVRKDRSQINKLYDAYERVAAVNVRVLGAVVNGESIRPVRRRLQPQLAAAAV